MYDINKGRAYYGSAIGRGSSQELWTDRPYKSGYQESNSTLSRLGTLGLGVGAYGLYRKFPDVAVGLTRAIEDHGLPFKWGRTFQLSSFMSHRESIVTKAMEKGHFVPGEKVDSQLGKYLQELTGRKATESQFAALGLSLIHI